MLYTSQHRCQSIAISYHLHIVIPLRSSKIHTSVWLPLNSPTQPRRDSRRKHEDSTNSTHGKAYRDRPTHILLIRSSSRYSEDLKFNEGVWRVFLLQTKPTQTQCWRQNCPKHCKTNKEGNNTTTTNLRHQQQQTQAELTHQHFGKDASYRKGDTQQ